MLLIVLLLLVTVGVSQQIEYPDNLKKKLNDSPQNSKLKQEKRDIDIKFSQFDSQVRQYITCPTPSLEVKMTILTVSGDIFTSDNQGHSWQNQTLNMKYSAEFERLAFEKVGRVQTVEQNPLEPNILFFQGSNNIHWLSEDCGLTIRAVNHGQQITYQLFHPFYKDTLLALSYPSTQPLFRHLYVSDDLSFTWNHLKQDVLQAAWAGVSHHHYYHCHQQHPRSLIYIQMQPDHTQSLFIMYDY